MFVIRSQLRIVTAMGLIAQGTSGAPHDGRFGDHRYGKSRLTCWTSKGS